MKELKVESVHVSQRKMPAIIMKTFSTLQKEREPNPQKRELKSLIDQQTMTESNKDLVYAEQYHLNQENTGQQRLKGRP